MVPVPDSILRSPLLRNCGGYAVFAGLPDLWTAQRLLDEAVAVYPGATAQESLEPDTAEGRGGKPQRRLLSSGAGPVQDAMYRAGWLAQILSEQCGLPIVPSGDRGSYSYYVRPGDFLDLHRDIETCDVALITALQDNSSPGDQGGALVLYPDRAQEPLSAIRSRPGDGARVIKLLPGQTIIMFGGVVPHCV